MTFLRLVTLGLCAALALSHSGAHAKSKAADEGVAGKHASFSVAPVPSWVTPLAEKAGAKVDPSPMHYRYLDEQTLVEEHSVSRFNRRVRVVNEAAGLTQAAQIEIEFDPSYQSLVLHHVDVIRNGKSTSRLNRNKVQMLQRETRLEQQMYDGRVTASLVLEDVRVGDQIDVAYTVRGDNPVFNGRFVETAWMAAVKGPVAQYQYRLIAPESRRIAYQLGSPDMQVSSKVANGLRETTVRRESIPIVHVDAGATVRAVMRHQVQFSEFADWADVTRWGHHLFTLDERATPLLDKQIAAIKTSASTPAEQVLAALRFVQTEVRYFGTETGLNSHQPESPEKIVAQRFGDCKDKAFLLVTMLRRLQINASPVLVSYFYRQHAQDLIPSPLAFDHVIAKVVLDGKTYWLDGTRALQTGTLDNRQAIIFHKGLVLDALATDNTALADLPSPFNVPRVIVQDRFTVARFDQGATLESRITFRADLADAYRDVLSRQSPTDIANQLSQTYARAFPKLKRLSPLRVEASSTDDAITLIQTYEIADFWRFPEQKTLQVDTVQWAIIDAIRPPNEPARHDDLVIDYPGIHRHITTLEFAEDVNQPTNSRFDDGDSRMALHMRYDQTPRKIEVNSEIQIKALEVPASAWSTHLAMVNKLAPRVGLSLNVPAISLANLEKLRVDMIDLDEQVKKGKASVTTRTQYQALIKSKILTLQLNEGRLSNDLRAQALTARGIQYDHLGEPAPAAQDFSQALLLSPDAVDTLRAAATNAIASSDYARGLSLADKVLAKDANDSDARNTRAMANFYLNQNTQARADLDELLQDPSQVRRGYPVLWLSLVASQSGQNVKEVLSRFTDDQLSNDWPRPLVDWARGRTSMSDVVKEATSGRESTERLCEVYYYVAERLLAENDKAHAKEFFRKVLALHVTEYLEDAAARQRLKSLGG